MLSDWNGGILHGKEYIPGPEPIPGQTTGARGECIIDILLNGNVVKMPLNIHMFYEKQIFFIQYILIVDSFPPSPPSSSSPQLPSDPCPYSLLLENKQQQASKEY